MTVKLDHLLADALYEWERTLAKGVKTTLKTRPVPYRNIMSPRD